MKKKVTNYKKEIGNLIRKKIREEMNSDFKKAFVPKGWAVVKVASFVDGLAKEIIENCVVLKKTRT
jgi:hypothetical protein